MKYEEYAALAHRASELADQGDSEGAIAIFRKIVDAKLATPDRVMMGLNIALLHAKRKESDLALQWYGTAIELEGRYHGRQALEGRAIYLAQLRRDTESLEDFEKLARHPSLNEADKARIWKYVQEINARSGT